MKRLTQICILLIAFIGFANLQAQEDHPTSALIIIDVQQFYFPGGKSELVEPEAASINAQELLNYFRKNNGLIVHVKHKSEKEGDIHPNVKPLDGEKVITKIEVSAFNDTELQRYLIANDVTDLVICGMMTHMCVEGTTRAAVDLGYNCTVISDACATKDLTFDDYKVESQDVHMSTFASLKGYYSEVMTTEEFLNHTQKK